MHPSPKTPHHQLHPHVPPYYGQKIQLAQQVDTFPKLGMSDKKFIKQVTGTFLFYARAIGSTMLGALSTISAKPADLTEAMMKKCRQFLDCFNIKYYVQEYFKN